MYKLWANRNPIYIYVYTIKLHSLFDLLWKWYLYGVINQFSNYKMQNRCHYSSIRCIRNSVQNIARNIRDCISVIIVCIASFARYPFFMRIQTHFDYHTVYCLKCTMHVFNWNCYELFMIDPNFCIVFLAPSFTPFVSLSSSHSAFFSFSFKFHLLFMLLIVSPVGCQLVGRSAFRMV